MYEDMFSKTFGQTENLVEPMLKANMMMVNNMEKLVNFQMATMQSYVDMGLQQMKAAAEINGPQAMQSYVSTQVETANTLRQKMLDDSKALAELGAEFKDEFTKLAEDNVKEVNKATPKASAKKAA